MHEIQVAEVGMGLESPTVRVAWRKKIPCLFDRGIKHGRFGAGAGRGKRGVGEGREGAMVGYNEGSLEITCNSRKSPSLSEVWKPCRKA